MDPNDPYDAETIRLTNNFGNWVLFDDAGQIDTDEFIKRARLFVEGKHPEINKESLEEDKKPLTRYTEDAMLYAYYPPILKSYNRATAVDFDPIQKQAMLEQEEQIRYMLARNQRRMVLPLYRGNPRHWMPVDNELYGKGKQGVKFLEQAKKVQKALGDPMPEQLKYWEENFHDPIPLPLTNENLSRWRDRRRVEFSSNFNPEDLAEGRLREQSFYYDRFDNYLN